MTTIFLMACATTEAPSQRVAANAPVGEEAQEKALFLHLLAPGTPPGAAAHRIASTRVYLSQDFSVSVGDADNPFTNRLGWSAVTTALIDLNGVAQRRPLEPLWNSGDAVLAGRIDRRGGKLYGQIQGRNQTTLSYFRGEIELEKPVEAHGSWYRGDVIRGVWFALCESPDCGEFLRALDNGTLRSPAVVERKSPEAKRWLELNSGKSTGAANAESPAERRIAPSRPESR